MGEPEKRKTTIVQLDRYKIIDKLISAGNYPSKEDIIAKVQQTLRENDFLNSYKHITYSTATFSRDMNYMRTKLHAPIKYDSEKKGYCYTEAFNFSLNVLSIEELRLLAVMKGVLGQYDAAPIYADAVKLIDRLYPASNADSFMARIEVSKRPKPLVSDEVYQKILEALSTNHTLSFKYFSTWDFTGRPEKNYERRYVLPYQLVIDEGQLYVYGMDKADKLPRLFNLCRIESLRIEAEQFSLPADYQFRESFERGRFGAFQYDESYFYEIEFYDEARIWVREYQWADDQVLVEDEEHKKTILKFSSSQWIPIERWLFSFWSLAKPLAPDWLVAFWKEEIKKMETRCN